MYFITKSCKFSMNEALSNMQSRKKCTKFGLRSLVLMVA